MNRYCLICAFHRTIPIWPGMNCSAVLEQRGTMKIYKMGLGVWILIALMARMDPPSNKDNLLVGLYPFNQY